jgi:TNF receptor-associated protein 1
MTAEQHSFQAEVQQLLNIVIHSLYTDKEIFIRELTSNAADALEKIRFIQASGQAIKEEDLPLKISIETDVKQSTITISDTGIGMTKEDLIQNLGTIARSGSKEFIQKLSEAKDRSLELIGQFGVGFYSSFMVAQKVEVFTRSFKPEETQGWKWTSLGAGSYEIEPVEGLQRGTKIILHLKDVEKEFAGSNIIKQIIQKYSSFVPFPIELNGEAIQTVQAIWTRNKSEVTDEQYDEFYRYISHDFESPSHRLHFTADAPLSIKALLFIPSKNYERLSLTPTEAQVHLYCKKVLIQSHAKGLFPQWMRFVKGVVDSEDMPLNISRETMQDSILMRKLSQVLTSRFIKMLEEESKFDLEKYAKFFMEFGPYLKEGAMTDYPNRIQLARLLRFETSFTEKDKLTSLEEYISRMPSDQKEIYFLVAADRESAEANPFFEVFKQKKMEVIFLHDPREEVVMNNIGEFDNKQLKSAEKADLIADQQSEQGLDKEESRSLCNWLKEILGSRVDEVRSSQRLVDSPAVVVETSEELTSSMRRLLKVVRHDAQRLEESKQNLEINPSHPVMIHLNTTRKNNSDLAKMIAEQILDNALISAGLLEDPQPMLRRVNTLMEKVLATAKN